MKAVEHEKVFLHADLDAFFASVEQHDHPEYRGRPVIVGGLPGDRRAVVSTASYEARKYGVHSAMPLAKAVSLCPDGIFLRGNHSRYAEVSHKIMEIFAEFSPTVIQMSIDEAFIDLTGTERLFGPPLDAAKKIKAKVKEETGLTVSAGIASTMYVAKIASGHRKPDGITLIEKGREEEFMLSLPLEKIWGIGQKTLSRLRNAGIFTAADIHSKSLSLLTSVFGKGTGSFLYDAVRGGEKVSFGEEAKNRSLSIERTFEFDINSMDAIETAFMELSEQLMWRMRIENVQARTVSIRIRYDDFKSTTAQESSENPVLNTDELFERCLRIFKRKYEKGKSIRLLGIGFSGIEDDTEKKHQAELFETAPQKKALVEKAIFEMERKNPALKIRKARLLSTEEEQNTLFRHGRND
ncbi:DNA polymerase IV [Treponema sp.]|uniref:DNA polymerase IV n=1 Tax=Treponema sp. TaxID=166 RepID=UPI003F05FDDA